MYEYKFEKRRSRCPFEVLQNWKRKARRSCLTVDRDGTWKKGSRGGNQKERNPQTEKEKTTNEKKKGSGVSRQERGLWKAGKTKWLH